MPLTPPNIRWSRTLGHSSLLPFNSLLSNVRVFPAYDRSTLIHSSVHQFLPCYVSRSFAAIQKTTHAMSRLNARGDIADASHGAPAGFTPTTSIVLRDIGPEEKHQVVFGSFPQSASSLHLHIHRPPSPVFDFEFPQAANNHPFLLRAPRTSHPDLHLPEYDSVPSIHLSTIAERLAVTPPMPEAVSPKSRPAELVAHSLAVLPSIPSLSSASASHPHPHPHPCPQDYPSPPERTLSPLRFGSPPDPSGEPFDAGQEAPPIVYSPRARDRFTRMVSSARSRGKARRALFDAERGVAAMWGLQGERAASCAV